ncbi:NucA/NucB deoxyribonuclease domain-containing protein [Streptomyces zagrosensis]
MKPGKGKSCDEYPFARTHEGGTKLPRRAVVSQPCPGVSRTNEAA